MNSSENHSANQHKQENTALKRKAPSKTVPKEKKIKLDSPTEPITVLSCDEFNERFKQAENISLDDNRAITSALSNNTPVIVKNLFKDKIERWTGDIPTEIEIARSVQHDNIAPILGVFKTGNNYLITMPDTKGEDLIESKLPEAWKIATPVRNKPGKYRAEKQPLTQDGINEVLAFACSVTNDVAKALRYLHEECLVVHQDIKPDNIILVEKENGFVEAQLIDFGLAKRYSPDEREFTVDGGTKPYVCREFYTGKLIHGPEADIFSLGVLIHWLIFDEFPFRTKAQVKANREAGLPPILNDPEFAPLREFLVNTLIKDSSKRWTASQVLASDWIRQLY